MEQGDTIVVGAGVVGLAVARALAEAGREVIVLERAATFGTETSSRNSEVLHAGIYYPSGSLKAQLCIEGRDLLYTYLAERDLPFRKCGKLIVAADAAQAARLAAIRANAENCGAGRLTMLDQRAATDLEPKLSCHSALLSPLTGIVDTHALMLSLLGDCEARGGVLVPATEAVTLEPDASGIVVKTRSTENGAEFQLTARTVINAAGLWAPKLAAATTGLSPDHVPLARYARGTWYGVPGRAVFSRLIYPIPEPGGLGIHLTIDLGGSMRFGPDVEWIENVDYRVSPHRSGHFADEIRKYWPALPEDALAPVSCGVRPKLHGPDEPAADFRIDGPLTHGIPGLINLFGIESPGLTASLAIGKLVAGLATLR